MGELPTFIDIRAPFSSSGALVITVLIHNGLLIVILVSIPDLKVMWQH